MAGLFMTSGQTFWLENSPRLLMLNPSYLIQFLVLFMKLNFDSTTYLDCGRELSCRSWRWSCLRGGRGWCRPRGACSPPAGSGGWDSLLLKGFQNLRCDCGQKNGIGDDSHSFSSSQERHSLTKTLVFHHKITDLYLGIVYNITRPLSPLAQN